MELEEYIKVIKKNMLIVAVLTLLGLVVAYYFSKNFQSGYLASQTFYISQDQSQQAQDASQSSYFTQEKARNFTDTAVAILQSSDFKNSLATRGAISVNKVAPQVIRITAAADDTTSAKNLMENVVSSFISKIKELSPTPSQLKSVDKLPEPQVAALSPKIILAFGAAVGFATSLAVIGLKTYFRL